MLQLKRITLSRGQKFLLEDASLLIHDGEKIGIVGRNGIGKSSLFKLIKHEIDSIAGEVELTNGTRISEIKQEIPHGNIPALQYVLSGDQALNEIQEQMRVAEAAQDGMKLSALHERYLEIDGYTAEARAAKILNGLGFSPNQLQLPVDDFSGGWRMRLNLAQMLLQPSDLLLLDEPTNHLDLEAIFWLENWLRDLKSTILIISHDREFLDQVVNRVVLVKDLKLLSFSGNYSSFEEQYAAQLEVQQASFLKQQRQISHLMKFVERFRYKASKAKQAQSRLKMVERIEKVSAVRLHNPFTFEFKHAPEVGNPILSLTKASVGYDETPLLSNIGLSLYGGDRIALLGPNGAGKSTFIKALAGDLKLQGEAVFNKKLKIGYFAQHQLESLNLEEGAFWHLKNLDRNLLEKEARTFLGSFNFIGDNIFEPVKSFSGGEKARLALALLVWQEPNILLLDEPSNHLDMEMREALTSALQMYDGALILVTHDRYLLKSLANEFYLVADSTVKLFDGDLDDYQRWVSDRQNNVEPKKADKPAKKISPQVKVAENDKQLARLEKKLAEKEAEKLSLELKLGDPDLYTSDGRSQELTSLTEDLAWVSLAIKTLEDEILELL